MSAKLWALSRGRHPYSTGRPSRCALAHILVPFQLELDLFSRSLACLSPCPLCNVGALWPNGCMDQDEIWHGGRPQPRPHGVTWGPSFPPQKGHSPQFSAHVCCGQTAGWIKMPLGTEVDLSPVDIVLDGDPSPPKKAGGHSTPNFWPMSFVAKRLDGSR